MKLSIIKTSILFFSILFLSTFVFGQSPKMILVEGGTFTMGSNSGVPEEKPAHKVTVSSFYICDHEVTVGEYKKFTGAAGHTMPEPPDKEWLDSHTPTKMLYASTGKTWWGWGTSLPMHHVTWFDAIKYCNWLSAQNGLEKCYTQNGDGGWDFNRAKNGYRLPTEAEWEFAARGGNKSQKFKYSGSNDINAVCWYDETSKLAGPKNVKTKKANELGIYDMSGNVWEWCSDYYKSSFYASSPATDPFCSTSTPYRVLRGGSWHYRAELAKVTSRDGPKAAKTNYNYGFRVAKNK
ncbi:MAG: formylglycine-generating enzyme family protein [Bacteroidales bacterium]|nr:formylglycine-generating enzyme family protein [Bacteroidales bacterium]